MAFKTTEIKKGKKYQSIKIPDKMKINDDKVYLKKVGNALYIIPFHNPWQNMLDSLDMFTSDFMTQREQPENDSRETLD